MALPLLFMALQWLFMALPWLFIASQCVIIALQWCSLLCHDFHFFDAKKKNPFGFGPKGFSKNSICVN
jgi:hypothetical protein